MNDSLEQRVADTADTFLHTVNQWGAIITPDLRVSENTAAKLTGYAVRSLQNLRSLGIGPTHYKKPLGGTRVSYRLSDLAVWIESEREI